MAIPLQDGTVLVFCIDTDNGPGESYGIVQTYSKNHTTETAEAKGAAGDTVSIQQFDDKIELSLNYLELGTPVSEPALGTAFTFDTVEYIINSINGTDTVDGFRSVDVTATNYPHLP